MAIKHKRKNSTNYSWQAADLAEGQVGLNIADGTLHFKRANATVVALRAIHVGTTAPDSPTVGQLWLDTSA